MALVLCDVDGTLLRGVGPYESSLEKAIEMVFGEQVSASEVTQGNYLGNTDRTILAQVLRGSEISYKGAEIDECLRKFGEVYRASDRETELIPGVSQAIPELHEKHILGLVTGNVQQMARKKLSLHALNAFFPFGGFGEQSYNKADLVLNACIKAVGKGWDARRAYIIGDSPVDMKAAIEAGSRIQTRVTPIGVTTGVATRDQLLGAGAKYVIDSLREL